MLVDDASRYNKAMAFPNTFLSGPDSQKNGDKYHGGSTKGTAEAASMLERGEA